MAVDAVSTVDKERVRSGRPPHSNKLINGAVNTDILVPHENLKAQYSRTLQKITRVCGAPVCSAMILSLIHI